MKIEILKIHKFLYEVITSITVYYLDYLVEHTNIMLTWRKSDSSFSSLFKLEDKFSATSPWDLEASLIIKKAFIVYYI